VYDNYSSYTNCNLLDDVHLIDIFHFHGTYLNGIYGKIKKINK
jgi:hypothetical protein